MAHGVQRYAELEDVSSAKRSRKLSHSHDKPSRGKGLRSMQAPGLLQLHVVMHSSVGVQCLFRKFLKEPRVTNPLAKLRERGKLRDGEKRQ